MKKGELAMSRKKRSISSFNEVASNNNIESDNKNDVNTNDNVIDDIIQGRKSKEQTHIFKGYYLERDVANTIDRITEGKPKGTKSDFVNEVIKRYLKSEGYM